MFYIRWTETDIERLSKRTRIHILLTEIDSDGEVRREIGLDENLNVVHRSPTEAEPYGLFDNQLIEIAGPRNDLTKEEFEKLWRSGRHLSSARVS